MTSMAAAAAPPEPRGSIFAIPAPIRSLFNHFPLHVYAPEPLPLRSPTHDRPTLYVFAGEDDARRGQPSYNPSCLKWQTLLRIAGVDVDLVPSNNHASPSGALPFLLPVGARPVTGEKIGLYAKEHASQAVQAPSIPTPRLEAYQALLTQNIRPAWVRRYSSPGSTPANPRPSSTPSTSSPQTTASSKRCISNQPPPPASSYTIPSAPPSTTPPRSRSSTRHGALRSPLHSSATT